MNTKRQAAYAAIDSERDYLDSRCGDRSVDEFILYIAGHSNDAVHSGSHFANTQVKLEILRKIAGLCVACLEQHGAPHRERLPKGPPT